jgi:hypothetical protein
MDGFPLDALNQKQMRRLRTVSDQTGMPIPNLITETLEQTKKAWIAEAELPSKIVSFPAAHGSCPDDLGDRYFRPFRPTHRAKSRRVNLITRAKTKSAAR